MSSMRLLKPELQSQYYHGRKTKFLLTSKYHDRTPGLFKAEFQGMRIIALTRKCYYTEDGESCPKISCKGISKKQNLMSWARYLVALHGSFDRVTNMGFWLYEQGIMTYTQDKLGLSAYYHKQVVDPGFSNHDMIYSIHKISSQLNRGPKIIKTCQLKHYDPQKFREDLQKFDGRVS